MKENKKKKYDYSKFSANEFGDALVLALKDPRVHYVKYHKDDVARLIKVRLPDGRYAWTIPNAAEIKQYKNETKAFREKENIDF